jgi:DNA-binding NarL/FixJ family response regulator
MTMGEVIAEALAIEPTSALPDAPALTARDRAAPSFPDGLSAREVDVLRLLADGRTTGEIGKQLVIQPRTVETHITHLYQKTGCRNRAEATKYAQRHGLV